MTPFAARVARTLCVGFAGGGVAQWLGLPAGALVGSAVAVSAASWAGVPMAMETRLRNAGFGSIGIFMGAGISSQILTLIPLWSFSLAFMAASIIATLAISTWILRSSLGLSRETALLSSTPGTMSYVLAIADDGRGDSSTILLLQTVRLFMLVAVLPVLIALFGVPEITPSQAESAAMPLPALLLVGLATMALGRIGTAVNLPATYLVGGMLASGTAHGADLVSGPPGEWLIFLGFALTGATLGSRFSGVDMRQLGRLAVASAIVVATAGAVSAVFAEIAGHLLGLPFGQLWVAYAPGGVEAMSAIGLALGYDPAFIALHHIARMTLLMLVLPFALNLPEAGRRA